MAPGSRSLPSSCRVPSCWYPYATITSVPDAGRSGATIIRRAGTTSGVAIGPTSDNGSTAIGTTTMTVAGVMCAGGETTTMTVARVVGTAVGGATTMTAARIEVGAAVETDAESRR